MKRISFLGLCRGYGKAHFAFCVAFEGKLVARAFAKGGSDVPRELRVFTPGAFCPADTRIAIVSVPMLAMSVTVELSSPASDDSASVSCRAAYNPRLSAVQSKLFSHSNHELAELMRSLDDRQVPGEPFARLTGVYPFEGRNVWRFVCRFPRCDARDAIAVQVVDGRMQAVDCAPVIMEDHVVPVSAANGALERIVSVSVPLDASIEHACVTFAPQGAPEAGAFACGYPSDVRAARGYSTWLASGVCASKNYRLWSAAHRATGAELSLQRSTLGALPHPLISIVVTVFNPPLNFLRDCVESVKAQSYDNWQLVLMNASGENEEVESYLASLDDARIVIQAIANRDIATNTNKGIELAEGDYVAFLDHDDVLEPDALFRYVAALSDNPDIDLFYSDEDRLHEGELRNPAFKTYPNLTKLYAYNYVTHFLMVSRYALKRTERSQPDVAGAQDYDLTLKCFEVARRIHHESRVLYHWREHEGSTAGGTDQKPYAHKAGQLALKRHLERRGLRVVVSDGVLPYTYDARFALPDEKPLVSVVIPSKDHADLLERCVRSILDRSTHENLEVIIVENNSSEAETFALYERLAADARVRIETWSPDLLVEGAPCENGFNYSSIVNFGAACSKGDFLVLLNNDTEVIEPAWIERMLGDLMRPEVGVVGAKLLFEDGLIQHAGMIANGNGDFAHVNRDLPGDALGYAYSAGMPQEYSMVTGACQMVSRKLFDELGGYDEQLAVGFNDGDFCLRVGEAGRVVVYEPRAVLRHREFSSRGRESTDARLAARLLHEKSRIIAKHPAFFASNDPAVNPNLNQLNDWWELGDWRG